MQTAQHRLIATNPGFWLETQVLDGKTAIHDPVQAGNAHDFVEIAARCVRENVFAAWQAAQMLKQRVVEHDHAAQIVEAMRRGKEFGGSCAVVPDHAMQGGAVAFPVMPAQRAGFIQPQSQALREIGGHGVVDVRKDVLARVVQGVVQIK